MIIGTLEIRNFGKIHHIVIHCRPGMNEICGSNDQGKSTILDTLPALIGGATGVRVEPLRHGAAKGEVSATITQDEKDEAIDAEFFKVGDFLMTRRFKRGAKDSSGRLSITAEGDSKILLSDLKSFLSIFTFDPLKFSRQSSAEQIAILKQLAGPEFMAELDRLDAAIVTAKAERADAKGKLKLLGKIAPPEKERCKPVEAEAIAAELRKAEATNRETERATRSIDQADEEIAHRTRQVAGLRDSLLAAEAALTESKAARAEMVDPVAMLDTSSILDRLGAASAVNTLAAQWDDYDRRIEESTAFAKDANAKEIAVERLQEDRETFALTAKLPIEGLRWDHDGVWLAAMPWDALSSSGALMLSARIGMALNPRFRVMRIQDGTLLDNDRFQQLEALCDEYGYQIFVETVGKGHSEHAIEIFEGERVDAPSF